jgi:hypothetical protein
VFLWYFWRKHPLRWDGWWAYYVDIPYHEALATSLATWGPSDNILVAGKPIRYHWFAHAWAGMTTNASGAGSFVVITRLVPLAALVGTICLTWAWSRRLSNLRAVPFLAVLVTTLGMDVGRGPAPLTFLENLSLSPSMAMAMLWLLGAALVLTEHFAGRLARPEALLFLLAVGCAGGKVSDAAVLVGGVGLAALASLFTRRCRQRVWLDLAVVGVAVAATYVVVIAGSAGGLVLEFGASAKAYLFLRNSTWIGLTIGTVAVALSIVAKWAGAGLLLGLRSTRYRPEVWFASGAAATGIFLMSVLGHPGNSQLLFPMSASVVVTVVCGWGLGESLRHLSTRALIACIAVGVASGLAGFASMSGFVDARTALPRWFWLAPVVVWLVAAAFVALALLVRRASGGRGLLILGISAMAWSLVVASLTFGSVTLTDAVRTGRFGPMPANGYQAFTSEHVAALVWLREHSNKNDIVATNRQCSAVQIGSAPCPHARWFLTAAISHRRMYIEGSDYAVSVGALPQWAKDRVTLSRGFVDRPTRAEADALWTAGVRWVVVDLASTKARNWSPYAQISFANRRSMILRLTAP